MSRKLIIHGGALLFAGVVLVGMPSAGWAHGGGGGGHGGGMMGGHMGGNFGGGFMGGQVGAVPSGFSMGGVGFGTHNGLNHGFGGYGGYASFGVYPYASSYFPYFSSGLGYDSGYSGYYGSYGGPYGIPFNGYGGTLPFSSVENFDRYFPPRTVAQPDVLGNIIGNAIGAPRSGSRAYRPVVHGPAVGATRQPAQPAADGAIQPAEAEVNTRMR
jgi:hypothetical protein